MTDFDVLMESRPRRLLRWCGAFVAGCAWVVILAWLVGRVCSDRFYWSQFLLWIPTPAAIIASLVGLFASKRPGFRKRTRLRRSRVWSLIVGSGLVFFLFVEYWFVPGFQSPAQGIKIVHWTMAHEKKPVEPQHQAVVRLRGDLCIFSDAYGLNWTRIMEMIDEPETRMFRVGRFYIVSRIPILEARPVVSNQGLEIVLLRIDASDTQGGEIVVYLVDLPSDPMVNRSEQARRGRRLLDEAGIPDADLVIGDFNAPRGSWSIRTLFPGLHHAYRDAGYGYAGTFHRAFPLYHLDHILLDDSLQATSYYIADPELGRHRVQIAHITSSSR